MVSLNSKSNSCCPVLGRAGDAKTDECQQQNPSEVNVSADSEDLPEEIRRGLLSFMREVDGQVKVGDMMGMVNFILEHVDRYPSLLNAIKVNEEALTKHIQETGEVPPGVRAIRKRAIPGTNVTRLDIVHGPATLPNDDD
ncbi:MAG: hypothetical protein WBD07_00845 [Vicinamibacterales bacterium]